MLLLRDHQKYMPVVEFFDSMTQGLSELSWLEAEYIALEVSKVNGSEFCTGIRSGVSNALNENNLKIDRLGIPVKFALKINQVAEAVTQKDVDDVLNAGWSEQTVEDIAGLVAIQRFYNVLATGLGFSQLSEEAFEGIGKNTVSSGGYAESFRGFISNKM